MLASEARKIAYDHNINEINSQYADIMKEIRELSGRGLYILSYSKSIKPDVRKKLNEDGYSVGIENSYMNEIYVEISWK